MVDMPTIEVLPASAAGDERLVASLVGLVNRVYVVAEEGLWIEGATRTTPEEMAGLIAAGEIAVARAAPGDQLVGAVRIRQLDVDAATGELGMLVAHPDRRSEGIGRYLVAFAEDRCASAGADTMQLELLVPRDGTHPVKKFLDAWYSRLGYRPVRTDRFDAHHPHLAPLLAVPCDVVVYQKPL
jgi:GNAT superfamily N-acetyltransferase